MANDVAPSTPENQRVRDPERTRSEILKVATAEFARLGYAGARVDEIAARTRTTKRMIYYYFGGKEQLFIAVLEQAYQRIRANEQDLDVSHLDPVAAIRRLAEISFDHHEAHPEFIRLVSIENIHDAEHMVRSETLSDLNWPAIEIIHKVLAAGREQGVFKAQVDAVDIHAMISSFCFFRVSNRATFGTLFHRDLTDPALRDHYRKMLGDMVVRYLAAEH